MLYNLYVRTQSSTFNIFGLTDSQLTKFVKAYLAANPDVTLKGRRYFISSLIEVKIYTYELSKPIQESIGYYLGNIHFRKMRKNQPGYFLPATTLSKMGKEVTESFIGDAEFGRDAITIATSSMPSAFVSEVRMAELKNITNSNFDLRRLLRLCEEINANYLSGNYLSVGMIGRTIINHVPPIFGFKSFEHVTANYGGPLEHKSFKKNMGHLNDSLRSIADGFLHQTIRSKEILPTETQIDFRQDLDVLLGEIVRILK